MKTAIQPKAKVQMRRSGAAGSIPAMAALLAEMQSLAQIMPPHHDAQQRRDVRRVVTAEDAVEAQFDNMPV